LDSYQLLSEVSKWTLVKDIRRIFGRNFYTLCRGWPIGVSSILTSAYHYWVRPGGIIVIVASVFLASCSGTAISPDAITPLQIGVDHSSLEPASIVVNLYESKHTEQSVHISIQGRAALLKALEEGDMGGIFVLGESNLTEYFRTPVARFNVTLIANKDIDIAQLTLDEIGRLFDGEISNWQTFGGANVPVQAIVYPEFSSEQIAFEELGFKPPLSNALMGNSPEEVISLVLSEPGAIGYVFGSVPANSVISLEIVYPDSFGPLGLLQPRLPQIPVLFVSLKQPSGDMRTLLDLALNPETQAQIGSGQ
jgi:hypothetical protein